MTVDLGVVGGGFWGISAAVQARERGLDVTVWDEGSEMAASPSAAGIIQRWWYDSVTTEKMLPEWWQPEYVDFGLEWLDDHVTLYDTGELYTSYQGADGRFREDCHVVDDCGELLNLHPTVDARVTALEPPESPMGPWTVTFEDRPPATCNALLVAAGAWTDDLLEASDLPPVGVEPLRGRALLLDPHDYTEAPPKSYDPEKDIPYEDRAGQPHSTPHTILPRPYTHYTLRPYRGHYRIGDTTERDLGGDEGSLTELMENAGKLVGDYDIERIVDGLRPVCDTFHVEEIARDCPRGVVATGGHRVGLLLAPICARRALQLLGLWGEPEVEA